MANHRKRKRRLRFDRRTPPGATPGSVVVDPHARLPRVQVFAYRGEELLEKQVTSLDELAPLLAGYDVTWVHVDGLGSAAMIERLAKIFHLHALAMEDVVNLHQRAKVEHYDQNLFVVARMPRPLEAHPDTEQLSLFLGPKYVLTLAEDPGDCLDPIRHRLQQSGAQIRQTGADHLAYAILDTVIDHYYPLLEELGDRLDALEDRVLGQPSTQTLVEIHQFKKDLLVLRRAIWPHREAINSLIRDPTPLVSAEARVFLRDCYDHVVQIMELVEAYREVGADLRDAYLSSVSNRMNDVMRVLTVISTIFIPLTFMTGVYGMNFDPDAGPWNMPELRWPWGYALVWGAIALVSAGMVYFFWRRGWLRPFAPNEVLRASNAALSDENSPPKP